MDNPYMTAAFMGQFQNGLQQAGANFTRAYEGAADRRQNAYLRAQDLEAQRQRDEAQRQFQNQQQAANFAHEDTTLSKTQGYQTERDASLFGQTMARDATQNVYQQGRDSTLHGYDAENATRNRGYTLEDAAMGVGQAPTPGVDMRPKIAEAKGRAYTADIGMKEAQAQRSQQQAAWYGKRGEQTEESANDKDTAAKDRLAEVILKDPTQQGSPLWKAAAAHASNRFGVVPQLDTLSGLLGGGNSAPAGKPAAGQNPQAPAAPVAPQAAPAMPAPAAPAPASHPLFDRQMRKVKQGSRGHDSQFIPLQPFVRGRGRVPVTPSVYAASQMPPQMPPQPPMNPYMQDPADWDSPGQ